MYQQMTLSPKLGVVEISTLWHFRLPLLRQIEHKTSPRLSGIGMPSLILWSHLLKMQRTVLLSSLLRWELGTNSLITGPGEWSSFWHFTSKLSWSWSPNLNKRMWLDRGSNLRPLNSQSDSLPTALVSPATGNGIFKEYDFPASSS